MEKSPLALKHVAESESFQPVRFTCDHERSGKTTYLLSYTTFWDLLKVQVDTALTSFASGILKESEEFARMILWIGVMPGTLFC